MAWSKLGTLLLLTAFVAGGHNALRQHQEGRGRKVVNSRTLKPLNADKMVMDVLSGHSLVMSRNVTHKVLDCSDVGKLSTPDNPYGACYAVVHKCHPSNGIMNYLALPYCAMPERKWVAFTILLIWVLVLCIWIFSIVDFLCPNLVAMTDVCQMRESVAGVTFLAFGHGAPEVFDMVASSLLDSNGMAMAVGQVLGQGMFVFCFVQGVVALMFPFVVKGSEFLRDSICYILGICMAVIVLADGNLTLLESCIMIFLYCIYMAIVIWFDTFLQFFGLPPVEDEAAMLERVNESKTLLSSERYKGYSYSFESSHGPELIEIRDYLNPVDVPKYVEGSPGERFFQIVQAPAILMLRLTVPTVDKERPNGGWCRAATCVQVGILPLFLVMFMYTHTLADYFTEVVVMASNFWGAILVGIGLSLLVYATTQPTYPPEYQMLFAFLGFGVCLIWIFATAQEIVNIMIALGQVAEVGRAILGMTLLAIGVASQELVCNIGLASAGHAGIAVAACIGSPLFIIYLGIGFAGTTGNLFVASPYPLAPSAQFTGGVIFLLVAVCLATVWLLFSRQADAPGFDLSAGRSYGAVLLLLYLCFIVVTVLFEVEYPEESSGQPSSETVPTSDSGGATEQAARAVGSALRHALLRILG